MKNPRFLLLVFTFAFSFLGYSQEPTKMKQVMDAHDEAMAEMPYLVKLVGQLQPKVDSTKSGQKHQEAIASLKTSNNSMMTWMQGFGERFTADEMMKGKTLTDEKKRWLDEEVIKVKALIEEISASIKNAEKLLEQ